MIQRLLASGQSREEKTKFKIGFPKRYKKNERTASAVFYQQLKNCKENADDFQSDNF